MRTLGRMVSALTLFVFSMDWIEAGQCVQLPPDAIAWWTADGDPDDLVGPHEGALGGGVGYALGMVGQGFDMDGIDDEIVIVDAPSLDLFHFTVAAWVRLDQVPGTTKHVLTKGAAGGSAELPGNNFNFVLTILGADSGANDRRIQAGFETGNGTNHVATGSTTLAVGTFYHVAVTYDGAAVRLYVNGAPDGLFATTATPEINARDVVVGNVNELSGAPNNHFPGMIDEVELFDRALTECELDTIVATGSNGQCKGDSDGDFELDYNDNCPGVHNVTQANLDGDLAGDACDCMPTDPTVFAVPGEIRSLTLGGAGNQDRLDWCSEDLVAGTATFFDVARGAVDELPVGTGASESCEDSVSAPTATDAGTPASGEGFWYLIRGRNSCGVGSYGFRSSGAERITTVCAP